MSGGKSLQNGAGLAFRGVCHARGVTLKFRRRHPVSGGKLLLYFQEYNGNIPLRLIPLPLRDIRALLEPWLS